MIRSFKIDWQIAIPALMLALLSLSVIKSVYPQLFLNQLFFLFSGSILYLFFCFLDFEILFSLHQINYFFTLILTISPYFIGEITRGAYRWIQIGGLTLQPSELLKPFYLITLAYLASKNRQTTSLDFVLLGIAPILIVFFQPDLGSSLVFLAGWLIIFLSKLTPKTVFIVFAGFTAITIPIFLWILKPYQQERIRTFLNPYNDPLGRGYHIIQSTIAVGSGGLFGKGLGSGTQTQLRFLPESHTDFIFSSLSEEFGFIGSILVIIIYLSLFKRIYYLSQFSPDAKTSYFVISCLTTLSFQTIVNIGMNISLLPITGVTLPLLSYGGSSIISIGIILGILNNISQKVQTKNSFEIK